MSHQQRVLQAAREVEVATLKQEVSELLQRLRGMGEARRVAHDRARHLEQQAIESERYFAGEIENQQRHFDERLAQVPPRPPSLPSMITLASRICTAKQTLTGIERALILKLALSGGFIYR